MGPRASDLRGQHSPVSDGPRGQSRLSRRSVIRVLSGPSRLRRHRYDRPEVEQTMRDAIQFHLDGMREDGDQIPAPHSYSTYCEAPA